MPDLVKKKKQEEEKKKQSQAAKPAVVKPAQAASAKTSTASAASTASTSKKKTTSGTTGAMGAGSGGYKVSIHNTLGANANASDERVMKVDMNRLKTTQNAVNVAKQISSDEERDAFLKSYQDHQKKTTGSKTRIDTLRSMVNKSQKGGVYSDKVVKSRAKEKEEREKAEKAREEAAKEREAQSAQPDAKAKIAKIAGAKVQGEEEDKPGLLDKVASMLGFGENALEPNKPDAYKDEEAQKAAEGAPTEERKGLFDTLGEIMSGKGLMDEEWLEEYESREETPKISQEPGYQGAYASATVSDVKPGQQKQYIEIKDDADVLRAYNAGQLDRVADEDKAVFLELTSSPTVMQLLGTVADESKAKSALVGNAAAEQVVRGNISALGTAAYDAYATIMSDAYPEELRDNAMLVLLQLGKRADDMQAAGTLGGDEMFPAMERLLETDEASRKELQSIYDGRDELIAQRNELRTQEQARTQQALDEAREAVRMGEYSEEQLVLVQANAPEADYKAINADQTRGQMRFQLNRNYFEPVYGGFEQTAIYKNLQSNGVLDAGEYKSAIKAQMETLIDEDTQTALSLGMSLEDYYGRIGGMSLDTIANRAAMRMNEQGASITQEEIETLDEGTAGNGIGAGATLGLGVLHGTNSLYASYADSIYIGLTEGNVIRTAGMMQVQYQQNYGINGREMYRADLEALLESGTVDESYAAALRTAMDETDDIYAMGIDPGAFEFVRVSGAQAEKNAETMEAYVGEKGTEAEQNAFGVISGATRNAEQALIGAGVTLATGNAQLGFTAAYDIPAFGDNAKKRFDEGYSRNTATFLAAADTVASHIANSATFENIMGRATGAKTLMDNALNWLKGSNPVGAVKGMAATKAYAMGKAAATGIVTAAQNIFDEAVLDEGKEGLMQSLVDTAIAPLFRKADAGEEIGIADYLGALVNIKDVDVAGVAADVKNNFVNAALTSSIFAVAGAAGATNFTYKGVRTAQTLPTQAKGMAAYDSVQKALDIVNGASSDVQGFMDAFKADLTNPAFVEAFGAAATEQSTAKKTAMNILRNNGQDGKLKQVAAKAEQAQAHEAKAAASQQAIDTAVQSVSEAQARIDAGAADDADVQAVIDGAEAIAKNRTGLEEHAREAKQKTDEANTLREEVMQEARAKAERQMRAEEARARESLLTNKDIAIADVNAQIEALSAEIEEAQQAFHESVQMEFDEDTQNELAQRIVDLEDRRDALMGVSPEPEDETARTDTQEQEKWAAYQERQKAQQEADEMKPVYSKLAQTKVYVDESQRANILSATGLKTLGQVSRKYGLRLTSEKSAGAVSLDGSFFTDLAELAPGRIDAQAAHPEDTLVALVERKKQLKGMQASVGETAYEKYLPDGEFYATQDPVMQQTASEIYKRTGVEVVTAPLANNIRALYDRANGRIVLSSHIGAGEAMRKAAMHELTHYIEGSAGYDAYKEAVLKAAYPSDTDGNLRAADEERIRETYTNSGIGLDEDGLTKELVAEATEKIVNDPDGRIVQQILDNGNRGLLARVRMKLTQFLARRKAKKEGTVDAYDAMRKAQQKLTEALRSAGKWAADATAEVDPTIGLETAGRRRGDMAYGAEGEQMQFAIERDADGGRFVRIEEDILDGVQEKDWARTVKNALRERFPNGVTVGRNQIRITGKSRGEITESKYTRWLKNNEPETYADKLRASGNADEILAVSDQYVNEGLKHPRTDRIVDFARGTVVLDVGGNGYEASVIVGTKDNGEMILYDLVDMKSVQIKKRTQRTAGQDAVHDRSAVSSDTISVADADTDVNTQSMQNDVQYALAPNQFANETIQRLNMFSDETKAVLAGRGHEAIANTERMDTAWQAVNTRGRDTVMDELMDKPIEEWTAQDNVNAALLGVLAESDGDLSAAAKILLKYDEAGTSAGQTLQARKIIQRMTPAGALAETMRSANRKNEGKGIPANSIPMGEEAPKTKVDTTDENGVTRRTHEKVAEVYDEASTLMRQLEGLPGEVSYDNPWNLPLSDKQMALIRAYKLEGQKLPGTAYNTATLRQRMLAAILAVNNEVQGSGLETVAQQLAAMKKGMAVVTAADMHYISSQMSEFKAIEGTNATEAISQAGKNALGRAWQAQDNVNTDGVLSKWGALRYANMLSSPATAVRNVMSNVLNTGLEGVATRLAVGIDKAVAKKTGTRTVDVATKEERRAGKAAFSKEVAQTMTDYFVTHTDTGHGRKYGPSHTGRVFQNEFLESYRNLVDFAMQIGDRPFYEQCYAEELAIIERLGMKKTEMKGGTKITRPMTEAEMKEEATARAVKRVFQEDTFITEWINKARENPTADLILSTLIPFVKTPTNVAMRAIDYSPVGLAITLARRGFGGIDTGKGLSISQSDYVMNLGRGLTGTGLMFAGWALASAGIIGWQGEDEDDEPGKGEEIRDALVGYGRGEEGNTKRRNVLSTLGVPYSMYINIGGTKHEIDWALPMAAAIAAGADFAKRLDDGEGLGWASLNAVISGMGDQLFSTPMLSSLQEIFQGYDDTTDTITRVLSTGATSLMNQTLSPAAIRAIAKYTDPYVRDTSDSNAVWASLKQNVVQYWPVMRGLLPVATDLTGDAMLQTGYWNYGKEHANAALHFLDSFFTPTATIGTKNDDALWELLDLSYEANDTACLPTSLIGAKNYTLAVTASYAKELGFKEGNKGIAFDIELTDDEKRQINQEYGSLLFNGSGTTKYADKKGEMVSVTGLRDMMRSAEWEQADPPGRVDLVEKKIKEVKLLIMKKVIDQKKKDG